MGLVMLKKVSFPLQLGGILVTNLKLRLKQSDLSKAPHLVAQPEMKFRHPDFKKPIFFPLKKTLSQRIM